jgi:3-methyladenine DNA glycosylase AlkD
VEHKKECENIKKDLLSMKDDSYKKFICNLIPNISDQTVIGIRTLILKKYAKTLKKECDTTDFLNNLPHEYLEENSLHSFLIMEIKDFSECIKKVDEFLPFVDNWAVCDSLRPKCFKNNKSELFGYIQKWIKSSHEYTVRFGIQMLMLHFLEDDFSPCHFKIIESIKRDEYYIKMMIAWYFSTALTVRFQDTVNFLIKNTLDVWTHNKTIQKAKESFKISDEQKTLLNTLRRKL